MNRLIQIVKNNRFLVFGIAAGAIVLASSIGGTYAYLTAQTTDVHNMFELGGVETEIFETTDSFGQKEACVVNTGISDCLVRARIETSIDDTATADKIEVDFNKDGSWVDGGDGYYYYMKVLPSTDKELIERGEDVYKATSNLINAYSITVDGVTYAEGKEVPKGLVLPDYQITVSQESVQAIGVFDGNKLSAYGKSGDEFISVAKQIFAAYEAK